MKYWHAKVLIGIVGSFIIAYALQWILWQWLWLAIPVWMVCYRLHEKYGIMNK